MADTKPASNIKPVSEHSDALKPTDNGATPQEPNRKLRKAEKQSLGTRQDLDSDEEVIRSIDTPPGEPYNDPHARP